MSRHHHQHDDAKQKVREGNLAAAEQLTILWDHDRHCLACDWVEITGHGDPTLRLLLERRALRLPMSTYHGVNAPDPSTAGKVPLDIRQAESDQILDDNATLYAHETASGLAQWHSGDILRLISEDRFPNAGILVYDGYDALNAHDLTPLLRACTTFGQRQANSRLGAALVIINTVVRGPKSVTDDWWKIVEAHTGRRRETFDHFTYQSSNRSRPMAVVRIPFHASRPPRQHLASHQLHPR